jgi:hypothetical protein
MKKVYAFYGPVCILSWSGWSHILLLLIAHKNIWWTFEIWSSWLCNYLCHPVTAFILSPDIAHSALLSKTLNLYTSRMVRGRVLTAGKTVSLYISKLGNGKMVQKLVVECVLLNKLLKTCFIQHLWFSLSPVTIQYFIWVVSAGYSLLP